MTDPNDLELRDNPLPEQQPDALAELLGDQEVKDHYHPAPVVIEKAPPPLCVVLASIEDKHRPTTMPACATCPAAIWRKRITVGADTPSIDCYCPIIHQFTYDGLQPVPLVMECDAQLRELAALEAKPENDHDNQPTPAHQP